ncbi:MAG: hypothetical protein ACK4E4_06770 [Rhodocyclaceae bacterium]
MASDLKLALAIELETAQGETALKRFENALDAALRKLGKSPQEIGLIKHLAREVEQGKRELDQIPAHYRAIVAQVNQAARGMRLLDATNITRSHAMIRAEIDAVARQFRALKQSGVLSHDELAQAATRARQKIRDLAEQMNGARQHGAALGHAFGRLHAAFNLFAGLLAGNGRRPARKGRARIETNSTITSSSRPSLWPTT